MVVTHRYRRIRPQLCQRIKHKHLIHPHPAIHSMTRTRHITENHPHLLRHIPINHQRRWGAPRSIVIMPVYLSAHSTITKHKSKTNYRSDKVILWLCWSSSLSCVLGTSSGDVFTKLEDEDDQGWCKGRVGNRVGLYPATYVEMAWASLIAFEFFSIFLS